MVPVNFFAIILSTVWSIFVGSVWYGPLFGKTWTKLIGLKTGKMDFKSKEMGKLYMFQLLGSLAMSYVLAHAYVFASSYMNTEGVAGGLTVGFWNWLGFIAPVTLGKVLWEGKPWKLWLIDNGNWLLTLLGMGVIISLLPAPIA